VAVIRDLSLWLRASRRLTACALEGGPCADKRVSGLDGRAVACQTVVRIPIGTALWEEAAFRGVLQAALGRLEPLTMKRGQPGRA
jgi:hypothetical protein